MPQPAVRHHHTVDCKVSHQGGGLDPSSMRGQQKLIGNDIHVHALHDDLHPLALLDLMISYEHVSLHLAEHSIDGHCSVSATCECMVLLRLHDEALH
jgi:hypothetical protein